MAAAAVPFHAGISDYVKDQINRNLYDAVERDEIGHNTLSLLLSPDREDVLLVDFTGGILQNPEHKNYIFIGVLRETNEQRELNDQEPIELGDVLPTLGGGNVIFLQRYDIWFVNQNNDPPVARFYNQETVERFLNPEQGKRESA